MLTHVVMYKDCPVPGTLLIVQCLTHSEGVTNIQRLRTARLHQALIKYVLGFKGGNQAHSILGNRKFKKSSKLLKSKTVNNKIINNI